MSENTKTLQTTTFLLGIVCFLWIIYDIIKINSDLKSVIFFDTTGKIVGIGYLLIFSFHILALIIFFKCLHNKKNIGLNIVLLILLIFSFFALIIEKVMFDEVLHEYYLEYPAPGEVIFIYFGLLINAVFILYGLYFINKEFKLIQFK